MPLTIKTSGYIELWRDGALLSRHVAESNAVEAAVAHAEANDDGDYELRYPSKVIMSRLRKSPVPYAWQPFSLSFVRGVARSVDLAGFLVNPERREVTYATVGSLPSGVTLTGSSVAYDGVGAVASTSVQFTATWRGLAAISSAVPVAITAAPTTNRAPSWTLTGAVAPTEKTLPSVGGTIQFTAIDPDGDMLTYSLRPKPDGFSINSSTGLVTVTSEAASYDDTITVFASDGLLEASTICAVTVEAPSSSEYPFVKPSRFNGASVGDRAYDADSVNWNPLTGAAFKSKLLVTASPVRSADSNRSLSVFVDQDDPEAIAEGEVGLERAEIRWGNPANLPATTGTVNGQTGIVITTADVWFGWSTFVPTTWKRMFNTASPFEEVFPIIQQWHHVKEAGATENNPWATVNIASNGTVPEWYVAASRNITRPALDENTYQYTSGRSPLRLGEWTDWVVKVRMHPTTGYFMAWKRDGGTSDVFVKVFDTHGRDAFYRGIKNGDGLIGTGVGFASQTNTLHCKSGCYVPLWDNNPKRTTKDVNGDRISTVQLYHAQYRAYYGTLANDNLGIAYVRPR